MTRARFTASTQRSCRQRSESWAWRWRSVEEQEGDPGVFDEGCMGMYNAIIDDALLNATGVFKERLSQSALFAAMRTVTDAEAGAVRTGLDKSGMTFATGRTRRRT